MPVPDCESSAFQASFPRVMRATPSPVAAKRMDWLLMGSLLEWSFPITEGGEPRVRSILPARCTQPPSCAGLPTGKEASADAAQVTLLTINPLPDLLGLLLAVRQVRLDLTWVTQVVGDDGVHEQKAEQVRQRIDSQQGDLSGIRARLLARRQPC